MGDGTRVEYEGKSYLLCCPMCIAKFQEDPATFVKMIEESMMNTTPEVMGDGHEGHDHP